MNIDNLKKCTKDELIEQLKKSVNEKESLEYFLNNLNGISWEYDLKKDSFIYVSDNIETILGYKPSAWKNLDSWASMLYEEDREETFLYCANETQKGLNHYMEYRMLKQNGDIIWVLDIVNVKKDENGVVNSLFGFIIDITKNKNRDLENTSEIKRLQTILDGMPDPVMIIDKNYTITQMNKQVKDKLLDKKLIDPNHPKCFEVSHHRSTPCDGLEHPCPLRESLLTGKEAVVVHNHKDKGGEDYFVELIANPLFDEDGNFTGVIESARDITAHINLANELKEQSKLLQYQAHHDVLTGLPNRLLFMDRLNQTVKDCHRNHKSMALLFIDLDYFKEINDTLGHDVGDATLIEVSKRFQEHIRENDTVARLGGDEFTIILKDVKDRDSVVTFCQKIIDIFKQPLNVMGYSVRLSSSIGICLYDKNEELSEEAILTFADDAMYKAKADGKNGFAFYKDTPA